MSDTAHDQLVAAHVDALERSRCLLEIVAAIKRLGQHDLWIVVVRLQGYCLFQPFLRVVEPVGKQRDPAQLERCRIVLRILSDDLRVDVASFGKLTCLKELTRGIVIRLLRSAVACTGKQVATIRVSAMLAYFIFVFLMSCRATRTVSEIGHRAHSSESGTTKGARRFRPSRALRLKPRA